MSHILKDQNRRLVNFDRSKVSEVLPEYFQTEFNSSSDLITFLEKYYDFLDSSGINSFKTEINNIIAARDIGQTDIDYLDELITEIGNGQTSSSFFQNPRLMAKLLPLFYSSKGTKLSAEGFFRGFFGEEVEVSYPKEGLLYVGGKDSTGTQGLIGFEDQFKVQDGGLNQILSILLRSGISKNQYEVLYKKFVHPAGFFFGTQVLTEGNGIVTLSASGENPLDSALGVVPLINEVETLLSTEFNDLTALVDDSDRITLNDAIDKYDEFNVDVLQSIYRRLDTLTTPNSFTFDDSASHAINTDSAYMGMSMITETMDNDMFTSYLSDSAI